MLQPSIRMTSEIMNLIILIVAGLCECGFTFCLAKASKSIPIGTAYPVWTGIGAVGTVLIITTLIVSVVGLKSYSRVETFPESTCETYDSAKDLFSSANDPAHGSQMA